MKFADLFFILPLTVSLTHFRCFMILENKKQLFIFLLLLIALPLLLYAGTTGKIVGRVVDAQSGAAIVGANIQIEGTHLGAASAADGVYIIFNIPPGTYALTASMIGYQKITKKKVIVRSDFTTKINFKLKPTTLEASETIEVVAERPLIRKDQTSSVAEFSGEEIRVMPVEDYRQVLANQAGVVPGANGALHIRGGRATEVSYVVDGIPITDPYSGLPSVAVENSAIQELSLVSGAFNAEYGEALSGVVNIVTREGGDQWQLSGQAYGGDYLSRDKDLFMNIDTLNPLSLYDAQISAGGPLLFGFKIFSNWRIYHNEGWLYGRRDFNISDSTNLNSEHPEDWFVRQTGDSAYVPMNNFDRLSANLKISRRLGQGKFSYSLLWNDARYREYLHKFKFTPDGNYRQKQQAVSQMFHYNYPLSDRAFLNLRYGYKYNFYRYAVFENPLDKRYVDPKRLNIPEYRFYTGGTGPYYLKRSTQGHVASGDLTWQINDAHQIKSGFNLELNRLYLREFTIRAKRDANGVEMRPFQPEVPPTSAIGSNEYTRYPISAAAYLQDKIELNSVVINIGLRYDYFNANTLFPSDPQNPAQSVKKRTPPKAQFSPRLGIAYPLTASGILHFSFGNFFQMPPYSYLYSNPEFEVASGSLTSTMGNPNLQPQRTTIYELGLQQQFTPTMAMDLTIYIKDIRNLLGQRFYRLENDVSSKYVLYYNRDYARVNGISLFIEKRMSDYWSATLNYTFQIARGNASDPNALFYDLLANPPRESPKNVVFLNWDQRHTLNATLTLGQIKRWFVSVIASYGSGLPYTPTYQNQRTAFENSGRKPLSLNFDLRAEYHFKYFHQALSVFLLANNLFDARNEKYVFEDTGRAGYTLQGQYVGNTGLYPLSEFTKRPDFYSEPRKIMVGLKFNFAKQ